MSAPYGRTPSSDGWSFQSTLRLLVAAMLALTLGYAGYLLIALGPDVVHLDWTAFVRGYQRILQPADLRGAPLRTDQGGADRVYLMTTQSERIVPLRPAGRGTAMPPRDLLHVDVWAFDAATVQPVWRRRVATFEQAGNLLDFQLLGADGGTLWVTVRQPIGIALADGAIVADGARLEAANPPLVGKRVDDPGYVAFGGEGLQLTLSDGIQWVVRASDLAARPRAKVPEHPAGIVPPAAGAPYTSRFQLRGLPIASSTWIGVLTDEEAELLRRPVVVPGAKPGERRAAAEEVYERQHVPQRLEAAPRPYRLWKAKVTKTSAAPRDWPADFPDNWGTWDRFSDYEALPEAPTFLQAGLLGEARSEQAFWYREPDSVLVLHHDKLGAAGRLRLTRIAGPGGRVVWDLPLTLGDLRSAMYGPRTIVLVGTEPNLAYVPESPVSRDAHEKIVSIDVPAGTVAVYDLTAESARDPEPMPAS